jgi:hypothetical protein
MAAKQTKGKNGNEKPVKPYTPEEVTLATRKMFSELAKLRQGGLIRGCCTQGCCGP